MTRSWVRFPQSALDSTSPSINQDSELIELLTIHVELSNLVYRMRFLSLMSSIERIPTINSKVFKFEATSAIIETSKGKIWQKKVNTDKISD